LDSEPSWDGRESAGPDNEDMVQPGSPHEWVKLTQADPPGDVLNGGGHGRAGRDGGSPQCRFANPRSGASAGTSALGASQSQPSSLPEMLVCVVQDRRPAFDPIEASKAALVVGDSYDGCDDQDRGE
jgi:hypothetical protein